jgi:SAM-dependent methyltransferase
VNRITAFADVCVVPATTLVLATILVAATWPSHAQSPVDAVERRDNPPLAAPNATAPAVEAVAPFAATPMIVVDEMLKLASAGPSDFVVDLGSGDGRLVLTAVTKFGARGGFGVDIDASLVDYANRKAQEAGAYDRARFYVRDLFVTDIHEATVVTVYLLPIAMNRLQAKLLAELAPGTRVVSHDYPFRSWPADRVVQLDVPEKSDYTGRRSTSIYLYTVPARAPRQAP